MSRHLLQHRHEPRERGVVFASFKGHESPLGRQATLAAFASGSSGIRSSTNSEVHRP